MLIKWIILVVFSLALVAACGGAIYIANTKNNYIPISLLFFSLATSLILMGYTKTTSMFNNLAQYTKNQISNEEIKGFKVLGLNYKTNKVTLKLSSGEVKGYTLTNYPVDIENPEAVGNEISSDFYAYLWNNKIASPVRLINWEDGTKSLTYKKAHESSLHTIKLGFDGFYKPQRDSFRR